MSYLEQYKAQLNKTNPTLQSEIIGCSLEECAKLEAYIKHKLPKVFREFIQWIGNSPLKILPGISFFLKYWLPEKKEDNLQIKACDLLDENEINTDVLDDCFVFSFYEGFYFEFFRFDEGENPPVYSYTEGGKIEQFYPTFSDYVLGHLIEKKLKPSNSVWVTKEADLYNHQSLDSAIQHISFSGDYAIDVIPDKVFEFENLISLDLQNTKLKSISPKINKLKKLKTLNLSFNRISKIPKELFELEELETLNLKKNRLTKLPVEIQEMKELKELFLNKNYFKSKQLTTLSEAMPWTNIYIDNQRQMNICQRIMQFVR